MQVFRMTKEQAEQYVNYTYAPPDTFYTIPKTNRAAVLADILSRAPGNSMYAVLNDNQKMIGFYEYTVRGSDEIELGLGLAPDETGHGLGRSFVTECIANLRRQYPEFTGRIVLRVADFNQRAIKVYEDCGFVAYDRQYAVSYTGPVTFICMRLREN